MSVIKHYPHQPRFASHPASVAFCICALQTEQEIFVSGDPFGMRFGALRGGSTLPKTRTNKLKTASMKINTLVQLATVSFFMVLGGSAQAAEHISFLGTIDGTETQAIEFPKMHVDGIATAKATGLGQFSVIAEHDVNLITGVGFASAVFDAGNADKLFTAIRAVGIPTGVAGSFRVTEYHTILNGTGRFDGATGSFKLIRLIDSKLASHGTFQGTIVIGSAAGEDKK